MTKSEWREQQRKLPFEEKLRILEDLRLRDLEIRATALALQYRSRRTNRIAEGHTSTPRAGEPR